MPKAPLCTFWAQTALHKKVIFETLIQIWPTPALSGHTPQAWLKLTDGIMLFTYKHDRFASFMSNSSFHELRLFLCQLAWLYRLSSGDPCCRKMETLFEQYRALQGSNLSIKKRREETKETMSIILPLHTLLLTLGSHAAGFDNLFFSPWCNCYFHACSFYTHRSL